MHKANRILLILLTIGSFFSCEKPSNNACIKSNGNIISEIRNLDNFNKLEINGNFKFTLKQDSVNKISIISGENLVPFITTDIANNTLTVDNKNKCRWMRSYDIPMEIELCFKDINTITLNGQNDIFCIDTIRTDTLFIENNSDISTININIICNRFILTTHAGTGNFILNGKTNQSFLYFHGTGSIDANNLEAKYCEIASLTIGDCFVNCKQTLIAQLYEKGNIYYSGNPTNIKVSKQLSTGELIKAD